MWAIAKTIQRDLSRLADKNERLMLIALRDWFAFTVRQLQRDLKSSFKKDVVSELTDWGAITNEGIKNIKPATLKIMQAGGKGAYNALAIKGSFSVLNVKAVKAAEEMTAKLVREVTDSTKEGIRLYIREGIKDGKSMPRLGRELRPLVGLTENQTQSVVNYRRLLEDKESANIDKKVQRYADKTHRRRAATIARTETARAQTIGYVQGLAENGIKQVEFSISPNACLAFCVPLDGTIYNVSEAEDIIPVHPNCRCAMLPVIDDQTTVDPLEKPAELAPDTPPNIPGPEGMDYEAASTDKQLNWEDKLTPTQLSSFDEYTAGEAEKILAAQRKVISGMAPSKLSVADKVWYDHALQMELALQRAPGFKGQVWRGLQFTSDKDPRLIALNRKITSKKPFTFDTTTSFTGSKDFANMVAQWDRVDDANVKVMIRMKKAPKRSSYMGNLSGVDDEAEILASVRTKYKVVGQSEKVVGKTRYLQYDLEEVVPKLVKPKLPVPKLPKPIVPTSVTGKTPTSLTTLPKKPPSVITSSEFEAAKERGEIVWYRGIKGEKASQYADDMRAGIQYVPKNDIFGTGTFIAVGKDAEAMGLFFANSGGGGGVVVRGVLKKGIKIISKNEAVAKIETVRKQFYVAYDKKMTQLITQARKGDTKAFTKIEVLLKEKNVFDATHKSYVADPSKWAQKNGYDGLRQYNGHSLSDEIVLFDLSKVKMVDKDIFTKLPKVQLIAKPSTLKLPKLDPALKPIKGVDDTGMELLRQPKIRSMADELMSLWNDKDFGFWSPMKEKELQAVYQRLRGIGFTDKGIAALSRPNLKLSIPVSDAVEFTLSQKKWWDNISISDRKTITDWKRSQGFIPGTQRRYLRGQLNLDNMTDRQKLNLSQAQTLERNIDLAPQPIGSIYRGTKFDETDVNWTKLRRKLHSEKPFSFDSLQSFTLDEKVANKFAGLTSGGSITEDIRIKIIINKSPKRSMWIGDVGSHKVEREVLVGSDSKYIVTKIDKELVRRTGNQPAYEKLTYYVKEVL